MYKIRMKQAVYFSLEIQFSGIFASVRCLSRSIHIVWSRWSTVYGNSIHDISLLWIMAVQFPPYPIHLNQLWNQRVWYGYRWQSNTVFFGFPLQPYCCNGVFISELKDLQQLLDKRIYLFASYSRLPNGPWLYMTDIGLRIYSSHRWRISSYRSISSRNTRIGKTHNNL
jgi:hypothetical protein